LSMDLGWLDCLFKTGAESRICSFPTAHRKVHARAETIAKIAI